jgi:lipopolysaccharide export system protein LptA
MLRRLLAFAAALLTALQLSAQTTKKSEQDSLVSLISAKSMELFDKDGESFRKVTGPAQFLHNNTYLICDTALWNVNTEEIYAIGHVKILQEGTQLTGDSLKYYINQNLAEFRGHIVQLEDKDRNMLRTRNLDYNTKDSVAIFRNGGSMKSSKGDVIESRSGTYDSKINQFTFSDNVNMFTDSVFVNTTSLTYYTDTDLAEFGLFTNAWKDESMLSSNGGWFDRPKNLFFFTNMVHAQDTSKEAWADSLFYHRNTGDLEVMGNVQVTDTSRHVTALAGLASYVDSISTLKLQRDPAIVGRVAQNNDGKDTVWVAGDTLIYRTLMKFQVPESDSLEAAKRLEDLATDAVMSYRRRAAEEAAEAAKKAAEENQNAQFQDRGPQAARKPDKSKSAASSESAPASAPTESTPPAEPVAPPSEPAVPDTMATQPADSSLHEPVLADSLAANQDSTVLAAQPKDSTKVAYITGLSRVRVFRSDIQMYSDSLQYNDLDSLIRLYDKPIVWNEDVRQYSADSIFAVIHDGRLSKASLMSDAFIIMQEKLDTSCFDQIRSTEMLAYFDTTAGRLSRFDALGDASAIFYIKEDSVLATVNKSAAKMLYAAFKDGDIDRIHYFESVSNDAYPRAQMTKDDRFLKGFHWEPGKRPKGPSDITTRRIRPSQMDEYSSRVRPRYVETDRYYPGYISGIYKEISKRDSLSRVHATEEKERKAFVQDSLAAARDSLALRDSLARADSLAIAASGAGLPAAKDSTALADSLAGRGLSAADSLARADSLAKAASNLSPKELKRQQHEAQAKARADAKAAKAAAKERRWAQLDSLDAAKAQAKLDKKNARDRAKKLDAYKRQLQQDQKDNARLERYKARYERQKARDDARKARRDSLAAARDAARASSADSLATPVAADPLAAPQPADSATTLHPAATAPIQLPASSPDTLHPGTPWKSDIFSLHYTEYFLPLGQKKRRI